MAWEIDKREPPHTLTFVGACTFAVEPNQLLAKIPLRGDELVLLAGTIVQGIGNHTSDYDLYVVGEERPSAELRTPRRGDIVSDGKLNYMLDALTPEGPTFDVDFFTFADVDRFAEALHRADQNARRSLYPFGNALMGEPEDFINSLRTAVPLRHPERLAALRARFPAGQFAWVKFRELANSFGQFEDVIGAWQARDFASCQHMLRDLVISQTIALGQLLESRSFKRKWFAQILRDVSQKEPQLANHVRSWLSRAGGVGNSPGVITSGLDLLGDIFRAIRARLDRIRSPLGGVDYRRLLASEAAFTGLGSIAERRAHEYYSRLFLNEGLSLPALLEARSLADFRKRATH